MATNVCKERWQRKAASSGGGSGIKLPLRLIIIMRNYDYMSSNSSGGGGGGGVRLVSGNMHTKSSYRAAHLQHF